MKKAISILLVVLMFASLSVNAFAVGNISKQESASMTEVASAQDTDGADVKANASLHTETAESNSDVAAFIAEFDSIYSSNEELQKAAKNRGVEVASAFSADFGEAKMPVKAEFKLSHPNLFVAVMQFIDGEWKVLPSELKGDTLSVEIPANGLCTVVALVPHAGPSTHQETVETFIPSTGNTVTTVVTVVDADNQNVTPKLIVTPYDKKYSLDQDDRNTFNAETKAMDESFEAFVAAHPEFEGTAPSDSFYVSADNPKALQLPAQVTVSLENSDIFSALLVYANGEWKQVDAAVDASGNLSFSLNLFGTYIVLSQAA